MSWVKPILILYFFSFSFLVMADPTDSIGVEKSNGKSFIIHKVERGQTLFSISRQYKIKPADIYAFNPEAAPGLKLGMLIKIPSKQTIAQLPKKEQITPSTQTKSVSKVNNPVKKHKVEKGQGLYAIAKMYGASIAEVKNWNKMSSNELKVGQVLIVSSPENIQSTDKQTIVKHLKTTHQSHFVSGTQMLDTIEVRKRIVTEGAGNKSYETGIAEVNSQGLNDANYEALHETAAKGTYLSIKNLANDQKVMVRVVGKLPHDLNPKIIIRITKKAQQRLAILDTQFAVEVSYLP